MSDTIDINVNKIVETIDVFANFEHPNIEINTIEIVDNVEVNATPNVVQININSISGDVEWGEIDGILSNQTDLQNALDLKANASDLGDVAFSNDYNDLDNLPTIPNNLEELHNVTETNYTTPIDADSLLTFDVTNSLWKRLSWANIKSNLKTYFDTIYQTALGFIPENVANKANDLTSPDNTKYPTTLAVSTALSGKQDTLTNPITGTGANGQVAFFNETTTQTGDSGLFWDNTNKRLGVGTNSPTHRLSVDGDLKVKSNSVISAGFNTNRTALISIGASADGAFFDLYSNVGLAGTQDLGYAIFAKGLPSNSTNSEVLEFRYDRNARRYSMNSIAYGTGTLLPISLYTGTNTNQLVLNTNGNVSVGASTAGARLDVRAQGALATAIAFRVRNSTDTRNFLVVNGAGDVYNNGAGGINTNTFFGENVGRNATGGSNTTFGNEAGRDLTTGASNALFGYNAGRNITTQNGNTFIGTRAGESSISNNNTAVGTNSLVLNTTGFNNTAIGVEALYYNTTGGVNTALGNGAGINNTTGGRNIFLGTSSGGGNTTGQRNVYAGMEVAFFNNGSNNTLLGEQSGLFLSDGGTILTSLNNSVFIGQGTRALANNQTNQIVIGNSAIGLGSNSVVLGNTSITRTALRGQTSINTDTIDASAQLQVDSTTRGFLPPRMTTTQRNAIASPAAGLIVYDTTENKHYGYNGTTWNAFY